MKLFWKLWEQGYVKGPLRPHSPSWAAAPRKAAASEEANSERDDAEASGLDPRDFLLGPLGKS